MKKRVFIVHGWGANSKDHWFPWLKKELEKHGFEANVLDMPDTNHPKMELWIPQIASVVGVPDENTYLVGHSIGANAIIRYLASIDGKKIGGIVLVAPYFGGISRNVGREKEIADPWIYTKVDLNKVKMATKNFTAIFSDNDMAVPIENKDFFDKNFSSKNIIKHNMGHFNDEDGVTELPDVLNEILLFS